MLISLDLSRDFLGDSLEGTGMLIPGTSQSSIPHRPSPTLAERHPLKAPILIFTRTRAVHLIVDASSD